MGFLQFVSRAALWEVSGPILLVAFVFLPRAAANRCNELLARAATAATLLALIAAGAASFHLVLMGPTKHVFAAWGRFQLGLYFDALSAVIFSLVAFLGVVVMRYSINYLRGDSEHGYFLKWLCVTVGSVLTLIISGNLVMFTAAWVATSLSLNKLLTFYADRPAALVAARKKFVISRLGDICLLGAIILSLRIFGTWEFGEMFSRAETIRQGGPVSGEVTLLCLLLVAGAMLKSAQFPFHSWLPDTMETPTPVSALMHAGIINAGGFLIIRMSPVVSLSPAALQVLIVGGAFTAVFGSLVMMTQASVKRMLAFSTIAQMGFMMLQCGLGAYAFAVLHIVAHSLYKAHAFLSSGSVVSISRASWTPVAEPVAHPGVLAASFGGALALFTGAAWAWHVSILHGTGALVLGAAFVMALGHLLWSLWGQSISTRLILAGLLLGGTVSLAYFGLHSAISTLLSSLQPHTSPVGSGNAVISVAVAILLGATLVLQSQIPAWSSSEWCRVLYVHARNGFYFNTLANRAIQAVWPAH